MRKPCNICIEESCNGRYNCDCSKCKLSRECNKFLRAIIRITNKCTQKCSHCCFSSSPSSNIMMSIDTSILISKFLRNNDINHINITGGEFFMNPDWYEILTNLLDSVSYARLVTNGDWSVNSEVTDKLLNIIDKFKSKLVISVSFDKFHTNKNVESARKVLSGIDGLAFNIADGSEVTEYSLVPVGRSEFNFSYYSLGCYCHNPDNKYTFLLDEEGEIYKCPFGLLGYDNISNYLDGGFDKRFKEVSQAFYNKSNSILLSCSKCYRLVDMNPTKIKCISNE